MYRSTPTLHMSAPQWVISKLSTSGAKIKISETNNATKFMLKSFLHSYMFFPKELEGFEVEGQRQNEWKIISLKKKWSREILDLW